MSRTLSPSTHQLYGLARVAAAWGLPRSTLLDGIDGSGRAGKRGPKIDRTDSARNVYWGRTPEILGAAPGRRRPHLQGSGAPDAGSSTSGAPTPGRTRCAQGATGTITTDRPNQMWGIDATATVTLDDGAVTVFAAIDLPPIVSAFTPPNGRRVLKPSIPSGKASKSTSPAFTPTRPPGFDSVMIMGPNS